MWVRDTGQPKTEVTMLRVVNLLDNSLKLGHPGNGQVTVHEQDPTATVQVLSDHLLSLRTLAATKRDLFALFGHVRVLGEAFEACNGVRALRKDKDERSGDRAILV